MSQPFLITRRAFLAGLGAGFAIGVAPSFSHADPLGAEAASGLAPNMFVHVGTDGTVTIVCHRSEMGQGIRSTIPALIADELGADPARVVVLQAEGDKKKYGDQNTDGSRSIRWGYEPLRQVGAAARMMLVAAAAKRWKVSSASCTTRMGQVVHSPTKRTLGFGELAAAAAKLPVPKKKAIVLRPADELTHVNEPNSRLLDGVAYVTGTAVFGADVKLPGMLIAVIARPPVVGGKVARFDDARALAIPGVKRIIELPVPQRPWMFQPLGGIAVLADNTWAALRGCDALDITWDHGENVSYDSPAFRDACLASVRKPGTTLRNVGNVDAVFATAKSIVQAEYIVPHLSHMQMEPLAAIARIVDGRAEIWAPTQHPQAARTEVARVLGITEDKVTVNVTLLGGGFGRKSKADFISEAAFLAQQAGLPVRVQWTREDDVRHGYHNAAGAQMLRAALDQGKVTAWHHRTAFTPIGNTFAAKVDTPTANDLQQGVLDLALAAPNVRAEACKAQPRSRIGWYRSVYNIFHAFSVGSFVDELAHAIGKDPRAMWLDVIGPPKQHSLVDLGIEALSNYGESLEKHPVDAGRLRHVIERVTDTADWSNRKGRALGLAAHRSFVSYAACVISVVADADRKMRIDQAWICMDAGLVVNQERVRSQLEGSVIMGISNALYGGITFTKGAVDQTNFNDARVARIRDVPRKIHTDIVTSSAPPAGVGEPGVPPVAPALANAIFALNGQRIREIPIARTLGI